MEPTDEKTVLSGRVCLYYKEKTSYRRPRVDRVVKPAVGITEFAVLPRPEQLIGNKHEIVLRSCEYKCIIQFVLRPTEGGMATLGITNKSKQPIRRLLMYIGGRSFESYLQKVIGWAVRPLYRSSAVLEGLGHKAFDALKSASWFSLRKQRTFPPIGRKKRNPGLTR